MGAKILVFGVSRKGVWQVAVQVLGRALAKVEKVPRDRKQNYLPPSCWDYHLGNFSTNGCPGLD